MDRFLDPLRRMIGKEKGEAKDTLARPEKLFNEITNCFQELRVAGTALHDSRPDKETKDALEREFVTLNNMHIELVEKPDADRRAPENDRPNALHAHEREAEIFKKDLERHMETVFSILGIEKTHGSMRSFYNPAEYDQDKELWAYMSKLHELRQALNTFHIAYKAVFPAPLSHYEKKS